jgi:phage FluMu gp28-like protein
LAISFSDVVGIYHDYVLFDHQKEWYISILENKYTGILACRQIGKSYILALSAITIAVLENQNILVISESEDKAKNIISEVREHLQTIENVLGETIHVPKSSGTQNITLTSGKTIKAVPGQPTALQGYTGTVLVDELAITRHDPEEMLAQALAVSSSEDKYRVVVCSNADKKGSFVHNLFCTEDDYWNERKKPWKLFNTNIYQRFGIQEWKPELLPETFQNIHSSINKKLWRRFYENAFLEAGHGRFDLEGYKVQAFDLRGSHKIIGYDPGYTENPSGIVVAEVGDGLINILETKKLYRVEVKDQLQYIDELFNKYQPRFLVLDKGGSIPIEQDLKRKWGKRIIPINVNHKFYEDTATELDYFLQTKSISIFSNELLQEIELVEVDGTKINLPKSRPNPLPHPKAMDHCDLYVALCLCITQVQRRVQKAFTPNANVPNSPRFLNR